jgi:hypothetical protein
VRLRNVNVNWTRTGFLRILARMGGRVEGELEPRGAAQPGRAGRHARGDRGPLAATRVEAAEVPLAIDELPLGGAARVLRRGRDVVTGAAELKVKESDRIATVVDGPARPRAEIEATPDGFAVAARPPGLRGGVLDAHGDHRLAMLGAVAGLASHEGVEVRGFEAAASPIPASPTDLAAALERDDAARGGPGGGFAGTRVRLETTPMAVDLACRVCLGDLRPSVAGRGTTLTAAALAPSQHEPGRHADLFSCPDCGTVQQPALPGHDVLVELYRDMADDAYLVEETGRRATATRLLDLVGEHVPAGRLLDVGCGHGLCSTRRGGGATRPSASSCPARPPGTRATASDSTCARRRSSTSTPSGGSTSSCSSTSSSTSTTRCPGSTTARRSCAPTACSAS